LAITKEDEMSVLHCSESNSYALLIGINDYTTFSPSGRDNLVGSVNDALSAARLAYELGCPPENIHLCLADPHADLEELRGRLDPAIADAHVSGADHAEILQCLSWLASALTAPQAKGLLWFSGHGFSNVQGPALCPADTLSGDGAPQNLLYNRDVLDALSVRHPESHLTVILDACHSAATAKPDMRPRALSAALTLTRNSTVDLCYERYGNVVALAARSHEQGWELTGAGVRHGAFSWAVLTVLRRWGVTDRPLGTRIDRFVDLTHADLMDKVRRMLDTLEIPQRPMLYAAPNALNRTVFHGFGNLDMSSADPDEEGGRELFPGAGGGGVTEYVVTGSSVISALYISDAHLKGVAEQHWRPATMYFDGPLPANTASFKVAGGTVNVGETLTPKSTWSAYEDADLKPSTIGSLTPDWLITTGDYYTGSSGSVIIGGMKVESDGSLSWYRTDYDSQSMPSRIASTATTTVYFTGNAALQKSISPLWERNDAPV
jgi:hypothetical protein